tara:strand:+ start:780 stop:2738 length:1959 start_codon:yes stop_codon:yes gene_type:complete
MKKFTISMIIFCFCVSFTFAQTNNFQPKKSQQEVSIKINDKNNINSTQARSGSDCIFSDDFSDPSTWVVEHDETACSLDWEIGTGLSAGGSYAITTIESTTVDNGFAMIDSDEYGGEEGGTEVEDSWFTTASAIDLSNYPNVVLQFETWYRSWTYEKCWVVTSTDGVTWPELTPDSEADPSAGIYEVFPGISGEGGEGLDDNPTTWRINISPSAGGESQVWVRFHWTGTWGYTWFVDDVCIIEQPADDLVLNYGVVSHTGTGEEYGRIPKDQVGNSMAFGGEVFNFGVNNQSGVTLSMDMALDGNTISSGETGFTMYSVDGDGFYSVEETDGYIDADESVYFEMSMDNPSTEMGLYTNDFTITSDAEIDGTDNFSNNMQTREFEITEDLYSLDGIGVYENADITRMGTGSFTDATDGFMIMTYYELDQATDVAGLEIMLDSYAYETPLSAAGGEVVISLRDTADVNAETFNPSATIVESDFYMVSQTDIDNGYLQLEFDSPESLPAGAYYACVEMYSNNNQADIYVLDDETVPQPFGASLIYIPGDQVYTNGTASAVRLKLGNGANWGNINIEEDILPSVSVYPNPSNGIINVNIEDNREYSIEITNILGDIIILKEINSNNSIDLSQFGKGTYLVKVSSSDLSKTEKIVIE